MRLEPSVKVWTRTDEGQDMTAGREGKEPIRVVFREQAGDSRGGEAERGGFPVSDVGGG